MYLTQFLCQRGRCRSTSPKKGNAEYLPKRGNTEYLLKKRNAEYLPKKVNTEYLPQKGEHRVPPPKRGTQSTSQKRGTQSASLKGEHRYLPKKGNTEYLPKKGNTEYHRRTQHHSVYVCLSLVSVSPNWLYWALKHKDSCLQKGPELFWDKPDLDSCVLFCQPLAYEMQPSQFLPSVTAIPWY